MNLKMKSGMTALTLVALAGLGAGCEQAGVGNMQTRRAAAQLGITNADYVKNDEVGHSVHLTHAISAADLDWTLGLLAGTKNPLVRARAMTILAQVHPLTAAQKARIAPAVAPFLSSTDSLESSLARRINRSL